MTGQGPPKAIDHETAINALLDGELDEAAAAALKSRAAGDSLLSQAIVDAWALQRGMETLQLEKVPASLRHRLRSIPRQQERLLRRPRFGMPRWAVATGLASVALLALAMMMSGPAGQSQAPKQHAASLSADELARAEQARRDLAIAFFYLDKTGFQVARRMSELLNQELAEPVRDELNKRLPFTGQIRKEEHA